METCFLPGVFFVLRRKFIKLRRKLVKLRRKLVKLRRNFKNRDMSAQLFLYLHECFLISP